MNKIIYFFSIVLIGLISIVSCSSRSPEDDQALLIPMLSLQQHNYEEWQQGQQKLYSLIELSEDKSQADYTQKAKVNLDAAQKIDLAVGELFALIESAKTDLFKSMGEELNSESSKSIVSKAYSEKNPSEPSMYSLYLVKNTENTTILSKNGDFGTKIISAMREYRKTINALLISSLNVDPTEKKYFFKDPEIQSYTNLANLYSSLDRAIGESNVGYDDREQLKRVYATLSYQDSKWEQILQENTSWIAAFGILTSLQSDILLSRRYVFEAFYARFSWSGNSIFNQLEVIVIGPSTAQKGEDVYFEVHMGVMSEDLQPRVDIQAGAELVETKNGRAYLKTNVGSASEMTITGTVSLRLSNGTIKTLPWSKRIQVL